LRDLWIVIHWDDGILYQGYDKEKAFEVYEHAKTYEKEIYDVENFETSGEESITIFKAVKCFFGVSSHHFAEFAEHDYSK
jgi:hypothetical protein